MRQMIITKHSILTVALILLYILPIPQVWGAAPAKVETATTVKSRIAVARFGATASLEQAYKEWNIGGGLAAQLVTALIDSGKAIVVDRAILSKILLEQDLTESHLTTPETGAPGGQLLGVDYLVVGEITEFEQKAVGGSGHIGWLDWIFPKAAAQFTAAHVGMDIRIVDTRTGEVLHSHRSEGKAWEKAGSIDLNFPILAFGGDTFSKTPLGKATRTAIDNALGFILFAVDQQISPYATWIGSIIDQEDHSFYVNVGLTSGVKVGDRLQISSITRILQDPQTNQVIGVIENPVAEMTVTFVAEKFSKANVNGTTMPEKGDVVRLASAQKLSGVINHSSSNGEAIHAAAIAAKLSHLKMAYEARDLNRLQEETRISTERVQFLRQVFINYNIIHVSISEPFLSSTNQVAFAVVTITDLVDWKGNRVILAEKWRETRVEIQREDDQWGKVIW